MINFNLERTLNKLGNEGWELVSFGNGRVNTMVNG
jgi:hypothetical protein